MAIVCGLRPTARGLRVVQKERKIFRIGFHRTGTTGLALALEQLMCNVMEPRRVHAPNIGNNVLLLAAGLVKEFDSFTNAPSHTANRYLGATSLRGKPTLFLREPSPWLKIGSTYFGADAKTDTTS